MMALGARRASCRRAATPAATTSSLCHCTRTHTHLVCNSTRSLIVQAPSVAFHLPTQLDAEADFVIPKPPVANVPTHKAYTHLLLAPLLSKCATVLMGCAGEPGSAVRGAVAALPHFGSRFAVGHSEVAPAHHGRSACSDPSLLPDCSTV